MRQNPWFPKPNINPNSPRLYCFPYAGGGASAFRNWDLPQIEVVPVQLPGREDRFSEPLISDLDHLLEDLYEAFRTHVSAPFAFFGHSMGALIAYELTHLLREKGEALPQMLIVSGRAAPQLQLREEALHSLDRDAFIQKLKELDGTPQTIFEHEELLDLMIPIIRADFQLHETYTYNERKPLDLPLCVYGGLNDPHCPQESLAPWQEQVMQPIQQRQFPGSHFFIQQHSDLVFRSLKQDLEGLFSGVR